MSWLSLKVSPALVPLAALGLAACKGPDVAPTIAIRSPSQDAILAGYASVGVVLALEDDSNEPLTVTYTVDDGDPQTLIAEDCAGGCTVTARVDTAELADGEHTVTARVEDGSAQSAEVDEPRVFSVFDIPYVESLAVDEPNEGVFDGPNLEVEVHLLHDETAEWLGCAAMEEVQQEDVLYDGMAVPFQANESGELVLFRDIGFEVVRVVVIESDNNEHCPIWPALSETLESDVDDLYGISPPIDLSLMFSGPIEPAVPGTTGLRMERGRPIGR